MKNLKITRNIIDLKENVVGYCTDADNSRQFIITDNLDVYISQDQQDFSLWRRNAQLANEKKFDHGEVVLAEYIVESGFISLFLHSGYVYQLAVSTWCQGESHKVETLAKDTKLSCVKLSPAQDLIAVAYEDNALRISSLDFGPDTYQENALSQNDSVHKPVGVGWGSKETQFFGLDGRPSKEKADKDKLVLTEHDIDRADVIEASDMFKRLIKKKERNTVIDWRGDGQLLASLTYIPEVNKHYLKVWNRNLELQYMSEQLVTMERGLLCWIPNGQYVCCGQRRDRRINEVALFEKNGMVHQRITLPTLLVDFYIQEMTWSHDSNILAIIGVKFDIIDKTVSKRWLLLLYTMQNFHYYLKYSTYLNEMESDANSHYSACWNPINHHMLHVWSSSGQCHQFSCSAEVDFTYEKSIVFVQDASKVLITPFEYCNVPPPMCAIELELRQIISTIYVDPDNCDSLKIRTLDDDEYYLDEDQCSNRGTDDEISVRLCIPNQRLSELGSKYSSFFKRKLELNQQVHSNQVSRRDGTNTMIVDRSNITSIATSCNSFRLTKKFLIYTTIDNSLNLIPISEVLQRMQIDPSHTKSHAPLDNWSQPIEIGGTLVVVSEKDSKVVLQMPRGNLEIIHPRILVLSEIMFQLDQGRYASALKLARRHRVDLNFVCDYMIETSRDDFMEKFERFVRQIAEFDPSLLNLFITELNQDNTISGRYKNEMKFIYEATSNSIGTVINKIESVCCAFEWPSESVYLQPRLLCLLKPNPSRADEALKIIWTLDDEAKESALKFITYFVSIDQLFLDALSTYDTAIALMVAEHSSNDPKEYLALLDRFNSIGEDYLRNYTIDSHIKRYERAFENGVKYLYRLFEIQDRGEEAAEFANELVELVVSRRIFKSALSICVSCQAQMPYKSDSGDFLKKFSHSIATKFGDYLMEKRRHLEAGLIYSIADSKFADDLGNVARALKCLSLENDWEISLGMISLCKSDNLMDKLSSNLLMQGKAVEAALVRLLKPINELSRALVDKSKWHLAVAFSDNLGDTLSLIKTSIDDELQNLQTSVNEDLKTASDQFARLKKLIERGDQLHPSSGFVIDADNCINADSLSTIDGSEISSISGSKFGAIRRNTARSGAPSIKTRASSSKSSSTTAEKRRKIKLKEGSFYEDFALVLELKKFVDKQRTLQDLVRQLHASVIYFEDKDHFDDNDTMKDLNRLIENRYELAKNICKELWPRGQEAQAESQFSLYKRFVKRLQSEELYENLDFEVLISPDLPKEINRLCLS